MAAWIGSPGILLDRDRIRSDCHFRHQLAAARVLAAHNAYSSEYRRALNRMSHLLPSMASFPRCNRTYQILHAASKDGYAVGTYNCYNNDGVMAVIRAAEAKRSPAIIQLFPWTLRFQGSHYAEYVIRYAHSASVPIAVHLDHCIKKEDLELALTLNPAFDSIMIDASTSDAEANIQACKAYVERARVEGIAIEAELGRIEGEEDGLPNVDMESIMTSPEAAKHFVQETGVHFLAPSLGNIHGGYGPGGAERAWDLARLKAIDEALRSTTPLALHGTHPVSDELFLKAVACGVRKVNMNRTVRDSYTRFVAENAGKLELTKLQEEGVEVYQKDIERMMDVLGSSGKA